MLVYRTEEEIGSPREWIARALAAGFDGSAETARDRLIDWGAIEASIADAHAETEDVEDALTRLLRDATREAALAWTCAAAGDRDRQEVAGRRHRECLDALSRAALPRRARRRTPEGFAYYALYPERYTEAAAEYFAEHAPERVVVIGLRSIGTTLSGAVEAALLRLGARVRSFTVRPRGDPWDRELRLGASLRHELAACSGSPFLLVDEGPGMSGSSLTGAASALVALGVPRHRVAFLPAHAPDASRFASEAARRLWPEHRAYVGRFEPSWSRREDGTDRVADASGGAWRRLVPRAAGIAAQSQHERKKCFVRGDDGGFVEHRRFAGLGPYGARVVRRAEVLAELGFGPAVRGSGDGALRLEFVPGRLLSPGAVDGRLLDAIGRYTAALRRAFPGSGPADLEHLVEATSSNVREALGAEALPEGSRALERWIPRLPRTTTVVDGRMQPHEWIDSGERIVKLDGFDHGNGHFLPGPVDIAWDVAGAAVEFSLSPPQVAALAAAHAHHSDDPRIDDRLPFYSVAYLAHRTAYCALARMALAGTLDGAGFAVLAARYTNALKRALARCPAP